MLKDGLYFPFIDWFEALYELFYGGAALQILEEGVYGQPGPGEYPGSAKSSRYAFDCRTFFPVNHTIASLSVTGFSIAGWLPALILPRGESEWNGMLATGYHHAYRSGDPRWHHGSRCGQFV